MVRYRVKELARVQKLTQFELAAKSDLSLSVVQRLWQNKAPEGMRHITLEAIATALGVQISDLFAAEDEPVGATLRVNRESLGAVVA